MSQRHRKRLAAGEWYTAPLHTRWSELRAKYRIGERLRPCPGPLVRKMIFQRRAFEVACRRAGIPRCTPHDLRRTFASWLLQEGVPERDIADLLGHTKTNLVRSVYAKTSLDRLRGAVSKL